MDVVEIDYLIGELDLEQRNFSRHLSILRTAIGRIPQPEVTRSAYSSLNRLYKTSDRLKVIFRSLSHWISHELSIDLDEVLGSIKSDLEKAALQSSKQIEIECTPTELKIERGIALEFLKALEPMLAALVEFSLESSKEREARKKAALPKFKIQVIARTEDLFEISVHCDGNGITPPFVEEQGVQLSKKNIAADFIGIPSISSEWRFYLPKSLRHTKAVFFESAGRKLGLPAWCVQSDVALESPFVKLDANLDAGPMPINEDFTKSSIITVCSGINKINLVVDRKISGEVEVFVKQVDSSLDPHKKLFGLTLIDEDDESLLLILSPQCIVPRGKNEV